MVIWIVFQPLLQFQCGNFCTLYTTSGHAAPAPGQRATVR